MEIKVLGPGCPNCAKMEEMARRAVQELGLEATVTKVTDMAEIMRHTIRTPGLLVDGVLRHAGKPLPDVARMKVLLRG